MSNNNCLFCGIVSGEVPSRKIYEDQDFLAFLDISGDVFGHTLVVPKKHYESALACPPQVLANLLAVVQQIANHYVQNCGAEGINILANCGKAAEQSVMHLHFHIIPRTEKGPKSIYKTLKKNNFDFEKMQKIFKIN